MIQTREHTFKFSFPVTETPSWAAKVERWYQLDACAFGVTQAYSILKDRLGEKPDFLVLASKGSSNRTDHAFASGGALSPSKFVHTLPNSRSASLLQVMEWTGPLLCLQSDPQTKTSAIGEAKNLVNSGFAKVWVIGISGQNEHDYEVYFTEVFKAEK